MFAYPEISASLEDYLEIILTIIKEKGAAKANDIAKRLGVKNPSVTGALKALAEKGLINYTPYDLITLTPKGLEAAADVARRHSVLKSFFEKVLAIEPAEAEKAACKMEHVVAKEVLERFMLFTEFMEKCPRAGLSWVNGFNYNCDIQNTANCASCIKACLEDVKKNSMNKGKEPTMQTTLDKITVGQKARIKKVKPIGRTGVRLAEMGATSGATVEVEKVAPFGDPIEIKVKGYHLSLRKDEAEAIEVEMIN